MTAIPHAAEALTSASGRFEHSSARLLEAASGPDTAAMADALTDTSAAKAQFKAALAVIRFSNEMWDALMDIARDRRCGC